MEVVLRCARPFLRVEDKALVDSILREPGFDWSRLMYAAERQRVLPVVTKGLDQVDRNLVPDDVRRRMMASVEETQVKNRRLARELVRILNLLRADGITAITFKGPVMSVLIYGDLGLRQFSDIDVLVRRKDVPKAKRILLSNGYQPPERIPLSREWHFFNNEADVRLDLHDRITSYVMPDLRDYEIFWQARQSVTLLGQQIDSFSIEHTVLMLCMQISNDWQDRRKLLSKICDLSTYLETQTAIDWPKFLAFAESQGLRKSVLVALFITQRFHGVQMPQAIRRAIEADTLIASLDVQVEKRLFERVKRPIPLLEQIRSQTKFYDSFWPKLWRPLIRSVLLRPFLPTDMDEAFLKLPPSLYFLYYVSRPIRLVGTLFLRFFRTIKVR